MVLTRSTRVIAIAATGLCLPDQRWVDAFGVKTKLARPSVMRPRSTRVRSTVDIEQKIGVVETAWATPEIFQEKVLLETTNPSSAAVVLNEEPAVQPRKRRRKTKDPEVVLEGDLLENTPKMIALVWSSLALNALYLLQALSTVGSPLEALWTAAGAFVGYLIADLVSGVFHWSVDNYGDGRTPVFGGVIEAFQGHHVSPWTITHRPFENNVHKIAYAVLPLLALLRVVNPGPAGVAAGVTFLVGSLMSNEFHRFAHMVDPPALVSGLQGLGLTVSRKEHGRHHSSPFEEKYCIVTGICNGPLDRFRVFRFLERVVYEVNGVEPIAWKLDPAVKEEALSTGWLPFGGGQALAASVEDTAA